MTCYLVGVSKRMINRAENIVSALRSFLPPRLPFRFVLMLCSLALTSGQVDLRAQVGADDETKKKASVGWPVFRGNAQSSGVATTTLPAELNVVWEFKVPQGGFEGTPLIVELPDGKKTIYIADMDGKLFSIDFATGKKIGS